MIIYGYNPVIEALRAHPERIHFLAVSKTQGGKLQRLVDDARRVGRPIRFMTDDQLERLAGHHAHNGVVADVSEAGYASFEDSLTEATRFVLLLDGVQDPQNLGAILRVADGFGVDFVVVPEHESAGLTPGAVKASAGASQWVPVVQVTNLSRAIEALQKAGFWVYGAAAGGDDVASVDLKGKVALVMGSEEKGVRKNVAAHCDRMLSIPMRGRINSFNVATATAVLAYEVDRQNRGSR